MMQCPENADPMVWKKLMKTLNDGVIEEMEAMDAEDLKSAIAQSEKNIAEQEALKRADNALAAAKENVKVLGSAYNEAMKYQRAKQRLASVLLEAKGKL